GRPSADGPAWSGPRAGRRSRPGRPADTPPKGAGIPGRVGGKGQPIACRRRLICRTDDPAMRIGTAEASGRMQATSYADLYRDHRGGFLGLCRLMLADPADAEEVGQEVFLRLHREMQTGDRPIAWGPWLTRVAVNACLDRRRARWWRVWRESSDEL